MCCNPQTPSLNPYNPITTQQKDQAAVLQSALHSAATLQHSLRQALLLRLGRLSAADAAAEATVLALAEVDAPLPSSSEQEEVGRQLRRRVAALEGAMALLLGDGEDEDGLAQEQQEQLRTLQSLTQQLEAEAARKAAGQPAAGKGRFEWVDGPLVRALEGGHWLLLTNANLCPAAVLDRLNALLEPDGVLLLSEAGAPEEGGHARVLKPHRDFRLFLTVDPSLGEVSRAMRNRCVEVGVGWEDDGAFAPSSTAAALAVDEDGAGEQQQQQEARLALGGPLTLLVQRVLPPGAPLALAAAMVERHLALAAAVRATEAGHYQHQQQRKGQGTSWGAFGAATALRLAGALARWAATAGTLVARGVPWGQALAEAMARSYEGLLPPHLPLAAFLASEAEAAAASSGCMDDAVAVATAAAPARGAAVVPFYPLDAEGGRVVQDVAVFAALAELLLHPQSSPDGATRRLCLGWAQGQENEAGKPKGPAAAVDDEAAIVAADAAAAWAAASAKRLSLDDRRALAAACEGPDGGASAAFWLRLALLLLRRACPATVGLGPRAAAIAACVQRGPAPVPLDPAVPAAAEGIVRRCPLVARALELGLALAQVSAAPLEWPLDLEEGDGHAAATAVVVAGHAGFARARLALRIARACTLGRLPQLLREAEVLSADQQPQPRGLTWMMLAVHAAAAAAAAGAGEEGGAAGLVVTEWEGLEALPMLPLLPGFFATLDAAVGSAAQAATAAAEGPITTVNGLSLLLRRRDDLWAALDGVLAVTGPTEALQPGAFPWARFLAAWSRLAKAILQQDGPALLPGAEPRLRERLRHVVGRVQLAVERACGGQGLGLKDRLWKRGGHPAVPSTTAQARALVALRKLAQGLALASLEGGHHQQQQQEQSPLSVERAFVAGHPSVAVPLATRQEALAALCTLHWACTDEHRSAGGPPAPAAGGSILALPVSLAERVSTLQAALRDRVQDAVLDVSALAGEDRDSDDDDEELAAVAMEDGGRGQQQELVLLATEEDADAWARAQLGRLLHPWAAAQEARVLRLVQAATNALAAVADGVDGNDDATCGRQALTALRAAAEGSRALMEHALAHQARDPAHLRPYQTLVWAWEASGLEDADAEVLLLRPAEAAALRHLLLGLLAVLAAGWHAALWQGLGAEGRWELAVGEATALAAAVRMPAAAEDGGAAHRPDPAWILAAPFSRLVWSLLQWGGGDRGRYGLASLESGARRRRQLGDALELLAEARQAAAATRESMAVAVEGEEDAFLPAVADPVPLRDALAEVLLDAFGPTLPADASQALRELLYARAALAPSLDEAGAAAASLLGRSSDARLAQAAPTLAGPAVRALAEAVTATASSDCSSAEGVTRRLAAHGRAWALLGLLRYHLLLPSRPVDPGERPLAKRSLCLERLGGLRAEAAARHWVARLTRGLDVGDGGLLASVLAEARALEREAAALGSRAVERPSPEGDGAFIRLRREAMEAAGSLLTPDRVSALLAALTQPRGGEGSQQQLRAWQGAVGALSERLARGYPYHVDVAGPLLAALGDVRLGLALADSAAATAAAVATSGKASSWQQVATLARYPLRPEVEDAQEAGVDSLSPRLRVQALVARLCRLELTWHAVRDPATRRQLRAAAEAAMTALGEAWAEAEARAREARAKREALFRQREEAEAERDGADAAAVTSARRAEAAELRRLFPDDELPPELAAALGEAGAPEEEDEVAMGGLSDEQVATVVGAWARLAVAQGGGKGGSGDEGASAAVALLRPFLPVLRRLAFRLSYSLGASAALGPAGAVPVIAPGLDATLEASHVLALALAAESLEKEPPRGLGAALLAAGRKRRRALALARGRGPEDGPLEGDEGEAAAAAAMEALLAAGLAEEAAAGTTSASARAGALAGGFDFHHGPAPVSEVALAAPAVEALLRRLGSLLREWPGHASLVAAAVAADRVRKLGVRSPLSQVVGAVESALVAAQAWEAYTARQASLAAEMAALGRLVIRWRKLELETWPDLLVAQERRQAQRVARFWLHIHRLTRQAMGAVADSGEEGGGGGASESAWLLRELEGGGSSSNNAPAPPTVTAELRSLFDALDLLLRGSPLGEFEARLALLRAFAVEAHTTHIDDGGSGPGPVGRMLRLLVQYYMQFLPAVRARLQRVRAPLQQKLKDEARLCRWDDQTFHALRESAAKSHRRLAKLLRDHRLALDTPVAPVIEAELAEARAGPASEGGLGTGGNTKVPLGLKVFKEVAALRDHAPEELDAPPPPPPTTTAEGGEAAGGEGKNGEAKSAVGGRGGRRPASRRRGRRAGKGAKAGGVQQEGGHAAGEEEDVEDVSWMGHPLPSLQPGAAGGASEAAASAPDASYLARLPKLLPRMGAVLSRAVYDPAACRGSGGMAAWRGSEEVASAIFARLGALQSPGATKVCVGWLVGGFDWYACLFFFLVDPTRHNFSANILAPSLPPHHDSRQSRRPCWTCSGSYGSKGSGRAPRRRCGPCAIPSRSRTPLRPSPWRAYCFCPRRRRRPARVRRRVAALSLHHRLVGRHLLYLSTQLTPHQKPNTDAATGAQLTMASSKPAELPARVGEAWRKAERYYAKGLSEMMALRADALRQGPHRDVPAGQVCKVLDV